MFSNFLNIFTHAFPGDAVVKNPPANAGDARNMGLIPGSGRSHGEGNGNPVFLSGKFHEKRSLAGYCLWGREESDVTDRHTKHTYIVSSVSTLPPPSPTFALNTLSTALRSQRIKHCSYLDFISTFFLQHLEFIPLLVVLPQPTMILFFPCREISLLNMCSPLLALSLLNILPWLLRAFHPIPYLPIDSFTHLSWFRCNIPTEQNPWIFLWYFFYKFDFAKWFPF